MKKLSLLNIISIVLSVIAIALVGYSLLMKNTGNNAAENNRQMFVNSDSTTLRIAYINTDSLMENYLYVKDLLNELDVNKSQLENDFNKQKNQFQKDVDYFQQQVQNNSLSDQSAQEIYQKLLEKENELVQLQDNYNVQIAELQQANNDKLYNKVTDYINRYNQGNKYFDFIFNHSAINSALINVNEAYDITPVIVDGLNAEYEKENK